MAYARRTSGDTALRLADVDPADTAGLAREEAEAEFALLRGELREMQRELYAARLNSVLLVFQGMSTSGKDGAIRSTLSGVDPHGCRVERFRVPTPEELAHDFLWRVHRRAPARGEVVAYNRSHYEDVVVARVEGLAPADLWQQRYAQINDFERLLAANGTVILKFLLHISPEEQTRRLTKRRAQKRWKLSASDGEERERWTDYLAAYEDAIGQCAAPYAPWHVVPADHKWFRNLAVGEAVVEAMRAHSPEWLESIRQVPEPTGPS